MPSQTQDYDFVGSYNNLRVPSMDCERSVNLFEYVDPKTKKPKSLLPTSGLVNQGIAFLDSAGSPIAGGFRGQFVFKNAMYVVIGIYIFRVDQNLLVTLLGTFTGEIGTQTGYVGIDANDHQVIFVDGITGNLWDTTSNVFTTNIFNTDAFFPVAPIDVCFIDGFFVIPNGNTNGFQMSGLNDGLQWGENDEVFTTNFAMLPTILTMASTAHFPTNTKVEILAVAGNTPPTPLTTDTPYYVINLTATTISLSLTVNGSAITLTGDGTGVQTLITFGQFQQGFITSHPGNIVACRTLHRRVFFFSDFYTEVWENAGAGTNLPLRRQNALLIEYGTPCIGSIATGFDKLFFLSQSRDGLGPVMEIQGSQAAAISNSAIDSALTFYAVNADTLGVADARALIVKENGLIFYRLNFTKANHTYVYNDTMSDQQNKRWHEEEILNGNRHPAQTHAYYLGQNFVGSYTAPTLYSIDVTVSTNDNEAIKRMRIGRAACPPNYHRLRIDRFQIDLLQGSLEETLDIEPDLVLYTQTPERLLTQLGQNILISYGKQILADKRFPEVYFSYSKDGGQTYGPRLQAPMGQIGQRTFRTLVRKLGTTKRGQAFVPKVEFFGQIPFIVLGTSWSYEELPE